MVGHDVQTITGDNQGNLWIGTTSGVSKFDGANFTNYTTKNGLPSNHVNVIFIDSKQIIWFGTKKGLARFDGDSLVNFSSKNGLIDDCILSFVEDKKGKIWIGTTGGLSKFDGRPRQKSGDEPVGRFTNYKFSNDQSKNRINAMTTNNKDRYLWLGTQNGLYKFDTEKSFWTSAEKQIKNTAITSLVFDERGNLWLGTPEGLFRYNTSGIEEMLVSTEPNGNIIESLYLDIEGNLWLGTYLGLFKYRSAAFTHFTEKDGLQSNFIFQMFRDNDGYLWITTTDGGINRYDGQKFEVFNTENGLSHNNTVSGMQDSHGNIWIGTNGGLSRFMPEKTGAGEKSFVNYYKYNGLLSDSVGVMLEDKNNNLWLGGSGGVTKATVVNEKISFKKFHFGDNWDFQVWSAAEDDNSHLWFGTYKGGLWKYDGNTFEEQAQKLGIPNDVFLAMAKDSKGNLWFGTFAGVFMFDGNKTIHISEKNGLSSDLVYTLTFDHNEKFLWVGTNQALNKLHLQKFYQSGEIEIEHYGKEEGFVGVELNGNGAFLDEDGSIWFGTVNGLIKYNPNEYFPNERESKTSITGFRIFYKDTLLPQNATLPYDFNHISFEFSGICLTNPKKVRYQYKLEGHDKQWSPPSASNFATYSNLPHGKYTFVVKSCNNEDKWNEEPVTFSFKITAPFWKTWWFWALIALITGGLIWLTVHLRIQNIKWKAELNQKMEALKSQALRAQMNPHFLFNAMNSIQHYINNNEKEQANLYLSKFAQMMRAILDNSQKSTVSIADDLKALELFIEMEQLRFEGKFDYEITISKEIDSEYDQLPPMLIQPYVENAIMHGLRNKTEKGKLSISLVVEDNFLTCTIEDDGIGRKKADEIRKKEGEKTHEPAGMMITESRIQILNQLEGSKMNVKITDMKEEKGDEKGTRVKIYIPYIKEEI